MEEEKLSINHIRSVVNQLKRQAALSKPVKYWKMPIKNWELFEEMRRQGRVKQLPSGAWEVVDK